MSGRPVLQSTFEYRIWKSLESRTFPKGGPIQLINDIASYNGSMNATVLVMMLDEMKRSGITDSARIRDIVAKSRPSDCLPSVRAAGIMLEKGDPDSAEAMIAMSAASNENVLRQIAIARIRLARGDVAGASLAARTARGYDPSCMDAYGILMRTEPEGGWGQRENIQCILDGGRPVNAPADSRLQELYTIYYEWFTNHRNEATDRLISSRWYKEGDSEFKLASARMSADERDWRSASMVYSELIKDAAPPFVLVEAAGASLGTGDPRTALELLSKSGSRTNDSRKIAIRAHLMIGDRSGIAESVRSLLDSENSGSDEYIRAVGFLLDRGMDREASEILERYSKYIGDDSVTLTMRSAILMRGGDYPAAYYAAFKAVHKDGKDLAAKAQLARMLYLRDEPVKADRICEEILVSDPKNVDALKLMAARHMGAAAYDKAIGVCERILEAEPDDADAMCAMAEARAWTGDRGKADELFRKVVRLDGSRDRAVGIVSTMIGCGMLNEAESLAVWLEKLYSKDPALKRLKGNAQYSLGKYVEASVSYTEGIAMDPENAILWHSKGMADEAREDWESAQEAYGRAVALDHSEPSYWISLAIAQRRTGDMNSAVSSLNRAIELDRNSPEPLVIKASILASSSRHDEATYYLDHAHSIRPSDVRIMDLWADELVASGNQSKAADVLTKRLSVGPSDESSVKLSRIRLSAGDRSGALKVLDDALAASPGSAALIAERSRASDPSIGPAPEIPEPAPVIPETPVSKPKESPDPKAIGKMAEALLAAGDIRGAMRTIDAALSHDSEDQDLYCIKGLIILAKGDAEGAAFLVESALRSNPHHAGLHRTNALAKEAKGDLPKALAEIDMAIADGLDDSESNIIKGRILVDSGQRERGAISYAKAVAMNPDDVCTAELLAKLQMDLGDIGSAASTVSKSLRRDPRNISLMMMKAEIGLLQKDTESVKEASAMLSASEGQHKAEDARMREIRSELGIPEKEPEKVATEWKPAVKRSAEKVLRRAYTTHIPSNDLDLMDSMGLDSEMSASIAAYLSEEIEIGRIDPDMPDFASLEKKSNDVVMKIGKKDLESDPDVPLEKVFVSGGFRDADSAKRMRAYIRTAATQNIYRTNDAIASIAKGLDGSASVYDIMKNSKLGVYEAFAVRSLLAP